MHPPLFIRPLSGEEESQLRAGLRSADAFMLRCFRAEAEKLLTDLAVKTKALRDLQKKDVQFTRAKGFDTFCPLGPAIRLGADLEDLEVITRVNGSERQRGHTRMMAFPIVDLLVYVSLIPFSWLSYRRQSTQDRTTHDRGAPSADVVNLRAVDSGTPPRE